MVAIIRSVSAHPPSGMKSIDQYPFDLIGSSETPWVECRSLAPVPLSDQINHLDTRSPSQKRSVTDPDRRSLVLGAGVNVRKRFGVDQTVPPPRGVRIDQGNCSIGCETRYFVHVEFREVHKESPKQHAV